MKKLLISFSVFSLAFINAQLYTPGGTISSSLPAYPNVGINTAYPQYPLQVDGHAGFYDVIMGGDKWRFHKPDWGNQLHIVSRTSPSIAWDWTKAFIFNGDNGNFMIWGKFEAKEVKVTSTPTADFVFAEDYKLPKLEDVEKYIKEKKHLPEIASAKEMEKEGVNVGEFQIKLLQKIEELTLYSIEQNKMLKEQQDRIQILEERLKENTK